MAEPNPSYDELDALIESALRDQPLVAVPRGLHARITERVALASLEHQERIRFRKTLITGFVAGVVVVATTVAVVAFTNFHLLLDHGISGGLGLLDYHAATFELRWPVQLDGLYLVLSLLLGAVTVWVGRRSLLAPGGYSPDPESGEFPAVPGRMLRTR